MVKVLYSAGDGAQLGSQLSVCLSVSLSSLQAEEEREDRLKTLLLLLLMAHSLKKAELAVEAVLAAEAQKGWMMTIKFCVCFCRCQCCTGRRRR